MPGYRFAHTLLCLFAFFAVARDATGQRPEVVTCFSNSSTGSPGSLNRWPWLLENEQEVGQRCPSDLQPGVVYRLKSDVIVQAGGTASRVTPYWVMEYEPHRVNEVKEQLDNPQAAREGEIKALGQAIAGLQLTSDARKPFFDAEVRGIRNRRETRILLQQGTLLRFQQLAARHSFTMGVSLCVYAEVLNGPLRGQWVDIAFLANCQTGPNPYCQVKRAYLEASPRSGF